MTRYMMAQECTLSYLDCGLEASERDEARDRFFVTCTEEGANESRWKTAWRRDAFPLTKNLPYYCPYYWRRFSLKRNLKDEFWQKFSIMYHGTVPKYAGLISRNGFKPTLCQHDRMAVYLTPSIWYASHPRYSKVITYDGDFYQVVLECRVWTHKAQESGAWCPQTLKAGDMEIDPNISNDRMEFRWWSNEYVTQRMGLVVTAVMVRILRNDPMEVPSNAWWKNWSGEAALRKHCYGSWDSFNRQRKRTA